MRVLMLLLLPLAIAAAPASVPLGTFQTWLSSDKAPVTFTSGGVTVHVEALPCPVHPVGDSTCRWEGYNNQGLVTVRAPGKRPRSVKTDRQSEYARIAVVRFASGDRQPGVIVESQYGGSAGALTAQLLLPSGNDFRSVALSGLHGAFLEGKIADRPRDLSGDGRIDLQLFDGSFDSVFGCNACTPRPPLLFTVKDGRAVDESRDPALRGVFAADMARLAPICLSEQPDRNGACAAYVADAARAGQFEAAWAAMLEHYERSDALATHGGSAWETCRVPRSASVGSCPPEQVVPFPEALRAFLVQTGYIAS